ILDTLPLSHRLDQADRSSDSVRRVVLETKRKRKVEQELGVGLPGDLRIERLVDREHQIALDLREVGDEAVVHEQPAAVTKRVAVGLLNGRADRSTDMREEVPR